LTVDFTEVILVVLPENLPCCYRAREGSIRVTTTTRKYGNCTTCKNPTLADVAVLGIYQRQ